MDRQRPTVHSCIALRLPKQDDWWKEVLARTDDLGDLRLQLLKA